MVGRLCFSSLFHHFGNAAGTSLAVAIIGFSIFRFSLTHIVWLMMLSFFILGGYKRCAKCTDNKFYDESHPEKTAKQPNARLSFHHTNISVHWFYQCGFCPCASYPKHAVYHWYRDHDHRHIKFYLEQSTMQKKECIFNTP